MTIPLPNLDDRRWDDLVQEGRSLIPIHSPDWTDHNVHDPGIMLMELLAWITETDLYWLNRVPDAHRRQFLKLAGVTPQPPQPAHTILQITFPGEQAKHSPQRIPAGVQFEVEKSSSTIRFRTINDITIVDSEICAVQREYNGHFTNLIPTQRGNEPVTLWGEDPKPETVLYIGLTESLPPGQPISMYFYMAGEKTDTMERERIAAEATRQAAFCPPQRFRVDEMPLARTLTKAVAVSLHHYVRLKWEYRSSKGQWQPLDVEDETRALTLNGRILLCLPQGLPMKKARIGAIEAKLYYLRCHFSSGSYDKAPQVKNILLNSVEAEQAVPVDEPAPFMDGPLALIEVGQGNGRPGQQIHLPQPQVAKNSLSLWTYENGRWLGWQQHPDFIGSGRIDCHYMLVPESGLVIFGNGEKGRVVPEGCLIAVAYNTTLAERGNIRAERKLKVAETRINQTLLGDKLALISELITTNVVPGTGGAKAETIDQATARLLASRLHPVRAVTAADYAALSKETPGIHLARVEVRANLHSDFPCYHAPGVITVILVPYLPKEQPQPSLQLKQQVARYLAGRRIIGTRIEVVGPTYRRIVVQATVRAENNKNLAKLRQEILTRLANFFHPLHGGPGGTGWPLGRDVFRSEVLQLLDETEGVIYVSALEIAADDGELQCGNVCLTPLQLTTSGQHNIQVLTREDSGDR